MDVGLWIAQGFLAVVFLMAGFMKLAKSRAELHERMAWVEDFSAGSIKTIGVLELLGAIGVVLPGITGIAPVLVPVAATGLALGQLAAAAVHIRRSETQMVVVNLVLIAVAVFVAWGRFGNYPL